MDSNSRIPLMSKHVFKGLTLAFLMHSGLAIAADTERNAKNAFSDQTEMVYKADAIEQSKVVKGVVYEKGTKEPLINATIQVKGKPDTGTITDLDGNFSLKCSTGDVLVITYLSYLITPFI